MLVCFEGIDKSGKATLCNKVYQVLSDKGFVAKCFSFPNYESTSGKLIKSFLNGDLGKLQEIPYQLRSMLYALNRVEGVDELKEFLDIYTYYRLSDRIVLVDRYVMSQVHQNYDKIDDFYKVIKFVEDLEFRELGFPYPDYIFLLDVDPLVTRHRDGDNDLQEMNLGHQMSARDGYLRMANEKIWCNNWHILDATKNVDENVEKVVKTLEI